jgi:hypothetical protein
MDKLNVFILILVVISLFGIPNISAQSYRINNPLVISHSVRLDGSPSSDITCNITVKNPSDLILVDYKAMTYNTNTQQFNYTLAESNVSVLGSYCYDITCLSPTANATSSFCKSVTPAGLDIDFGQSILYIFVLIFSLILLVISVIAAVKLPFGNIKNNEGQIVGINNLKYLKIFFWGMAYIILLWITYMAWNVSFAFLYIPLVAELFHYCFIFLGIAALIFLPLALVYSAYHIYTDVRIQNKINKGLTVKDNYQ